MSMNNIVKPSLSQLPIEDIAAELKSDKDNRRFMTKITSYFIKSIKERAYLNV